MLVLGNRKWIWGKFKTYFLALIWSLVPEADPVGHEVDHRGWDGRCETLCKAIYACLQAPTPGLSEPDLLSPGPYTWRTLLCTSQVLLVRPASLLSAPGCDVPHDAVMKQDETHTTGSATSEGRGL